MASMLIVSSSLTKDVGEAVNASENAGVGGKLYEDVEGPDVKNDDEASFESSLLKESW